jgi:hypothetical protein
VLTLGWARTGWHGCWLLARNAGGCTLVAQRHHGLKVEGWTALYARRQVASADHLRDQADVYTKDFCSLTLRHPLSICHVRRLTPHVSEWASSTRQRTDPAEVHLKQRTPARNPRTGVLLLFIVRTQHGHQQLLHRPRAFFRAFAIARTYWPSRATGLPPNTYRLV